jgi:hypothetical protein
MKVIFVAKFKLWLAKFRIHLAATKSISFSLFEPKHQKLIQYILDTVDPVVEFIEVLEWSLGNCKL